MTPLLREIYRCLYQHGSPAPEEDAEYAEVCRCTERARVSLSKKLSEDASAELYMLEEYGHSQAMLEREWAFCRGAAFAARLLREMDDEERRNS